MDRVKFKINDVEHSVGSEVTSQMMLVDYLRKEAGLCGTKYMCREGGCGACLVSVTKYPGGPMVAVNSCLVSITSCQNWAITTIEEIGNRKKGYHILQKTLAENHGSQCGYCSSGWIQNMYSLLENGNKPTMLDIEKSFGGNICRCTGYRPIMTAFKKFGSDAPKESRIMDIEDLHICKKTGLSCNKSKCDDDDDEDWCILSDEEVKDSMIIKIELQDDKIWYKVSELKSIFEILGEHGCESYMLVYGNTAKGPYPLVEYPRILIDITTVSDLKTYTFDQNLYIGAGNTVNEIINIFETMAEKEYFGYLKKFIEHINLVASIPIKNLGSVGGNLMIKHQHNEFPSDLFLLFETVDAYLSIHAVNEVKKLTMQQFLQEDMNGKIIVDVILPPLSDNIKLETYKIMPRSQNAHAMVNAGFLFELTPANNVVRSRIVYGGLSSSFIRAGATEMFLVGKPLFSNKTLKSAMTILENELMVVDNPPEASVKYRKQLSLSLFYKCMITFCPKGMLNSRFVSGTTKIHETRPVSKGQQTFETDKSLWPLNQPIPKVDALIQCAGEAKYTDDLQVQKNEVYATFVLSTVPMGDIVQIDTSAALIIPGVLAVYTAADIPGENSFTSLSEPFYTGYEEVLASKKVAYYNQPIGIVVATTEHIANQAAKTVTATYSNVKEPVIDIQIAVNDPSRISLYYNLDAITKGTDVVKTIIGQNTIYSQIHLPMENMSCVTIPTEEGLECHVTTQWMDSCQLQISKALNMDTSQIDVYNRRIGGGIGMKISRPSQVAVGCSLVAAKLNRPCRLVNHLTTCTRAFGKRFPCHAKYELAVNAIGAIQYIRTDVYEDNGFMINELPAVFGVDAFNNCYTKDKWNFYYYNVITDTAKNTFCRSPGTLEVIALAETVMEQISYELSLDPFDVRLANLDTENYEAISVMIDELKLSASYAERKAKVAKFNSENRWRKRSLRCAVNRFSPIGNLVLEINLSICHGDGTVIITHGGIEMGQGINTKAVQICAYYFQIPVDKIQIKGNNTIIAPNCFLTGGSLGSQNVGAGVKRCCEAMLQRLEPIRAQLENPTWSELIAQAFLLNTDLQIHDYIGSTDTFIYDIFGVALAEVEIDVLTGESEILRVDILQDAGQSVNPEIDVGQVEGAFIMGQGYWTSEDVVYNNTTGEVLSNRTWNYYVPLARDIPQDFRVTFRNNSYSLEPILGAKATGEPPICLSVVIAFALREAIAAARQECGIPTTTWFNIDGAYTVEKINLACCLRKEDFIFT